MNETTRMQVLPLSGTINDSGGGGGGGGRGGSGDDDDDDPVGAGGESTKPPNHLLQQPHLTPQEGTLLTNNPNNNDNNNNVPAYIISSTPLCLSRDKGDEAERNDNDDEDEDDGYLSDCSSLGSKSVTTSARQRQRRDIFKSIVVVAAGAGAGAIPNNSNSNNNNNNIRNTNFVAHHHIYDSLEEEEEEIEHKRQKDNEVEAEGPGGRRSLLVNNGMGRLRVSLPPTLRKQQQQQQQQQKSEELVLQNQQQYHHQQQQQKKNDDSNIGGQNSYYFDGSEFFPPILLPPHNMRSSSSSSKVVASPSLSRPYDKDRHNDRDNGGCRDDDDGDCDKDMENRRSFDPFGIDDDDDDDEGYRCYLHTTTSNLTNNSDTSNESFSFLGHPQYHFDSERYSLASNNHRHHQNEEGREYSDEIVVEKEFEGTDNDSNNAVASTLGSKDEGSKYRARRPVKFLSQVVARTLGGAKQRKNQSSRRKHQELKPPIESSLLCYNSLSIGDKSYALRRRNSNDRFSISQDRQGQGDDRSSRSSRSTMSPPSPDSSAMGHNNVNFGQSHEGVDMQDVAPHKGGKDVWAEHGSGSDTSSPVLTSFKEATGQYSPTSVGKERHDQIYVNGLRSNNNGVDKPDGDRWLYSSALTLSSWDDFEGAHTFRCDSPAFIFYPSTFKQDVRQM